MYNLLNKTSDIPAGKISWNKKYKFKDKWGKYFLTYLKSPKTVQFNGSKAELIIKVYQPKLIGDPKCTFCIIIDEIIKQLLWECECVKQF